MQHVRLLLLPQEEGGGGGGQSATGKTAIADFRKVTQRSVCLFISLFVDFCFFAELFVGSTRPQQTNAMLICLPHSISIFLGTTDRQIPKPPSRSYRTTLT